MLAAVTVVIPDVRIVTKRVYFPVIRTAAAVHFDCQVTTLIGDAGNGHITAVKIDGGNAVVHFDDFIIQTAGQIDGYGVYKGIVLGVQRMHGDNRVMMLDDNIRGGAQ